MLKTEFGKTMSKGGIDCVLKKIGFTSASLSGEKKWSGRLDSN
jgi:hypothetical protein